MRLNGIIFQGTAVLLATIPAARASAQCMPGDKFSGAVSLASGDGPYSVRTADLDSDGDQDFAVVNSFESTVSIFLNEAGNSFILDGRYDTGGGWELVIADFNADSDLDLAVANGGTTGGMSVLLNLGDGTFAPEVRYETGLGPIGIDSADVNLDGTADLLVANSESDDVSILIGNGDGTFASEIRVEAGRHPFGIRAADMNGDGAPDFAVSNELGSNVSYFLNDGTGGFPLETRLFWDFGTSPLRLDIGDVDSSGEPDIVVTSHQTDEVVVFHNGGSGDFGPPLRYQIVGDGPTAVSLADFDGDSDLDILATNFGSGDCTLLVNNGQGFFGASASFPAGSAPFSVATADFNSDGRIDAVVANETSDDVSLLFNETEQCLADLDGNCVLNFFDVSAFLAYFQLGNPLADFTEDGNFDFFDVSAFLNAFNNGC